MLLAGRLVPSESLYLCSSAFIRGSKQVFETGFSLGMLPPLDRAVGTVDCAGYAPRRDRQCKLDLGASRMRVRRTLYSQEDHIVSDVQKAALSPEVVLAEMKKNGVTHVVW